MEKVLRLGGLGELVEMLRETAETSNRPASREEAKNMIDGRTLYAVGDIVKWRAGMKNARFPDYDQECVITQVLPQPYRTGSGASVEAAEPRDIAIAFTHHCGAEGCKAEGTFMEFLYDGRRFEKVGTIHN